MLKHMNQKSLFLATTLIALLVIAGAFWYLQKRQTAMNQPPIIITEPVVEAPVQTEPEKYPQHIETIPGNTDEVWYNIPELGIRMKLNKEFAEDLVYIQDNPNGVNFSTKKILSIAPSCLPEEGPLGYLFRSKGNMIEDAKTDEYLAAQMSEDVQIGEYYYGWVASQEGCWLLDLDQQADISPGKYQGNGVKTVSGSIKTIEPLK
jgi:hypothetical protein